MDFQDFLKQSAQEINQEIDRSFEKWSQEVESVSPKLTALNKAFIQANEGGKRIRGALIKLGYELAGGSPTMEILKPAAAFEIFQTAILAHDDIVDLSPLRRGKPTVYKVLGGNHYGISQALTLGDAGFFLAVRLIAETDFPDSRKNKALAFFAQAMLETALGQMLDIELPYQKETRKEVDALTIFRLKTARYTIVGPLALGAILGGAGKKFLEDVEKFGEALGIAFQIQDDTLGVFGDEKTIGKSVTSDIEEGKNTLLIIYALDRATKEQKVVLDKYYGKGKIGGKELEKIKQVFVDTGALEYSRKKAMELVTEALLVIEGMDISPEYKKLLTQMADFLVRRDK